MARAGLVRLKRDALRWSVTIHRWTGVVTCLFFLVWFATGAVMAFVPFPDLGRAERLALAEPLGAAPARLTPRQAFGADTARLRSVRLVRVGGRLHYIGDLGDGPPAIRSALTGAASDAVAPPQARAAAEHAGGAAAISVAGPLAYDQWIVNASYNTGRPFYRVRLADRDRTDLYVASRTGEIMQRTRAGERAWSWVGSIPHWAYYTVLGRHRLLWNQVCFYGSLFAFAVAVVGMVLGVERWLAVRRARRLSPFPERWMRWHHISGLFAGVLVLTWMGSGWLSNDNHRLFSSGAPDPQAAVRYGGAEDSPAYDRLPDARFAGATEVAYVHVGGAPYMVGRGGALTAPIVVDLRSGAAGAAVPIEDIARGIALGWPAAAGAAPRAVAVGDFYAKAEGYPPHALRFDVPGKGGLRVFVSQDTGQIVGAMDRSRRALAWLYYGLHTLQLPGLIGHETLRRTIECLLLLLGAGVAATGVVIGYTRVKRTVGDAS